ncbi:SLBB domain-containing protein [Vibrio furnissii]|uniref:SLBB domain-containing protein n=1 Tax=Vibrio furnissii TaxID=29494 RepID=UPI002572A621|nr:SLBB domain-containing protein [Vibrio furnissii]WJG21749.1 SLBB domain-containing protein [Vibrio furnissii]
MHKGYYSLAVGVMASLFFSAAYAAPTPTAAQLQMFRNLPADQQKALASQYGVSIPSGGQQATTYSNPQVMDARDNQSADGSDTQEKKQASDAKKGKNLKRFGLDLFAGSPSTFAPVSDVPVPSDYTVGAGDEIVIQLFGKENQTYRLRVNRAGVINFPELGPVQVAGMKFSEVRQSLTTRVEEQMIGMRADISMGELRSMQIFVMGDAYKPGAYTVSALTTISQAIYFSGGLSDSGALRDVQLKRDGKVIAKLDLYDLLLKGDASDDVRLMPGDVVYIAPVGPTVAIEGEVNRPAIYELKPGENYQNAVAMAGGFTANADDTQVEVKRYQANGSREVLTLDLTQNNAKRTALKNGDAITVVKKNDELTRYIELQGDVAQPGYREWKPGLKVSDLFSSLDSAFNRTADVNYALLVREINPQRDIEVLQFNLANALLKPESRDNLMLESRDRIVVFNRLSNRNLALLDEDQATAKSLDEAKQDAFDDQSQSQQASSQSVSRRNIEQLLGETHVTPEELQKLKGNTRRALLAPILLKLQEQSRLGLAPQVAEVFGEVKYPGRYPITENMSVSGLIEAAGGLTYDAFTINAELARRSINANDERTTTQIQRIDLRKALEKRTNSDVLIQGRDRLNVLEKPAANLQQTVVLQGEVRFPGTYTVRRGETMSQLLQRAGGLTEFANPKGAIFTREALRQQEQKLLNQYAEEMRKETVKKTFRADNNSSSVITDPEKTLQFVEEASKSKALGRMVVQLNRVMLEDPTADFMLEDGDFLYVPTFRNTVSIMGEVQVPVTYLLDNSLDVEDYISKAGGAKKQADEERIFVIRADGSVFKPTSSYWFGSHHPDLEAGDTIVVPLDTDYRDALNIWTAATQILYQTGVAVNALN